MPGPPDLEKPWPSPTGCAAAFVSSCLGGAPTPQSLKECFVQRLLCLQPLSDLLTTLGVFPALPMGKLLEEVK